MVVYFDFACVQKHFKKLLEETDGQNIPLLYTFFFIIILADDNECAKTPDICRGNATCKNKYKSYQCVCHNGYGGFPCKGNASF